MSPVSTAVQVPLGGGGGPPPGGGVPPPGGGVPPAGGVSSPGTSISSESRAATLSTIVFPRGSKPSGRSRAVLGELRKRRFAWPRRSEVKVSTVVSPPPASRSRSETGTEAPSRVARSTIQDPPSDILACSRAAARLPSRFAKLPPNFDSCPAAAGGRRKAASARIETRKRLDLGIVVMILPARCLWFPAAATRVALRVMQAWHHPPRERGRAPESLAGRPAARVLTASRSGGWGKPEWAAGSPRCALPPRWVRCPAIVEAGFRAREAPARRLRFRRAKPASRR